MNTKKYAQDLRNAIDIQRYATLLEKLGSDLNDRKDRFDKSDIIEQAVSVYSNNRLEWVDGIGRDHHDTVTGLDLEMKYTADGIFTKTKNPKKIISIKLKNSLGTHKGTQVDNPADFYIIAQQDSIALISWADLEPHLEAVSDGIMAKIPFDALTLIFAPSDVKMTNQLSESYNYKEQKAKMQKEFIDSV